MKKLSSDRIHYLRQRAHRLHMLTKSKKRKDKETKEKTARVIVTLITTR